MIVVFIVFAIPSQCFPLYHMYHFVLQVIGSRGSVEVTPRLLMMKEAIVSGLMLYAMCGVRIDNIHHCKFHNLLINRKLYIFYFCWYRHQQTVVSNDGTLYIDNLIVRERFVVFHNSKYLYYQEN